MDNQRTIKTENIKNLFKFTWKEDLPWILFFLFLLLTVYGYVDLLNRHNELLGKKCVWYCQAEEYITNQKKLNPSVQINCYYETQNCEFVGTNIIKNNDFFVDLSSIGEKSDNK